MISTRGKCLDGDRLDALAHIQNFVRNSPRGDELDEIVDFIASGYKPDTGALMSPSKRGWRSG